jgi:hypothetical protein
MARVNIENIIDYLDRDIRRALKDAVDKVLHGVKCDERKLFRAFKRAVSRRCSAWELVPDMYVEKAESGRGF